jgi:hypothetical protein
LTPTIPQGIDGRKAVDATLGFEKDFTNSSLWDKIALAEE